MLIPLASKKKWDLVVTVFKSFYDVTLPGSNLDLHCDILTMLPLSYALKHKELTLICALNIADSKGLQPYQSPILN